MSKKSQQSSHKWTADRPGERPEHDELGRKEFAQLVAKDLRAWRQRESLVVSLNGTWGSGKTTLANLILHYIAEQATAANEPKPIVVKFNPWQWSAQERLLQAFFDEIGGVFRGGRLRDKAAARNLARFWGGLKALTTAGAEMATRLQETLTAITSLAAGSGVLSSFVANPTAKGVLTWLSVGLLGVAGTCAVYAPLAEKLAGLFEWHAQKSLLSLGDVRANVRRELEKLDAPLLVVIDDLDRLTKPELLLLVQLVKANADFPNIIYLILFHRVVVAEALEEIAGKHGGDFLKKIVQVELEVPAASDHALRKMFRSQLEPVLTQAPWDQRRWGELFEDAVWPYFRTPRDIKRFRNTLEFYVAAHSAEGVLDVNLVDLVLIELLRTFDATAYEAVRGAELRLRNDLLGELYGDDELKTVFVGVTTPLLARKSISAREQRALRALLTGLLPQANERFTLSDEEQRAWLRERRICHPKCFHRYFQLSGDAADVPAALISRLMKPGADQADLRSLLKSAFENDAFYPLMDRLTAAGPDIQSETVEPLLTALLDLSDELPPCDVSILSLEPEPTVVMIAEMLLRRIDLEIDRASTLNRAVSATKAITAPVMLVSRLLAAHKRSTDSEAPLISRDALEKTKEYLLPRLWAAAKNGSIWRLHMTTELLFRLRDWAGIEGVRKWLSDALTDPSVAVAFLRSVLQQTRVSEEGGGSTVIYSVMLSVIEQFADPQIVHERAGAGAQDTLDTAAVEGLEKVIQFREGGRPIEALYVITRISDGSYVIRPRDQEFILR